MAQFIAPSLEMLMPRRLLFAVLLVAGEFFFCHYVSLSRSVAFGLSDNSDVHVYVYNTI